MQPAKIITFAPHRVAAAVGKSSAVPNDLDALVSSIADGTHFEPHGTLQHVAYFPHPGVICQFKLGAAGLQYLRGDDLAVIPIAELVRLFETHHPPFGAAPK